MILLVVIFIILCFGVVVFVGAPYLPTLQPQIVAGLELLDLKPGDTLLELGCGDGRVVVAAAKQGIRVVGYELNPLLAALCWLRTRRYGDQVQIVWGDFWRREWPAAEGIYGFILAKYMKKLDTKITQELPRPVRLVSFAFAIEGKQPIQTRDGLYLYEYR